MLIAVVAGACGGAAVRPDPGTGTGPEAAVAGIPWVEDDLAGAMERGKAERKPVFVDAWALWCHTCLSMQSYVLKDPALAPLAGRFVWLAVDTEKEENAGFLERYPIDVWPTFFVLDPEDGSVAGRWVGSMSVAQVRTFLEEGERTVQLAHAGQIPAGDPLALLREGDRAVLDGQHAEAARLYARARAAAPPDWPRRAEALTGEIRSLRKSGDMAGCVDLALAQLDRTGNAPSAGDFAMYGIDCADELGKGDPRVARLRAAAHDRLLALTQDASAPLTADDRGDIWRVIAELREAGGDPEGALEAARSRLAVLDAAAARAPDAQAASTFDWARAESLLKLGRGADPVRMLTESERRLPRDYNPPSRLARVHFQLGQLDEALAAIDRALALAYGPRKLGFYGLKADILERQGKRAEARRVVEEQLAYLRGLPREQQRPGQEKAITGRIEALR
jgi:tetratricopeptide (TPR) repeat protein